MNVDIKIKKRVLKVYKTLKRTETNFIFKFIHHVYVFQYPFVFSQDLKELQTLILLNKFALCKVNVNFH